MHLECPHCEQKLVFAGKRPSFCAYCGKAIEQQLPDSTATRDAEAATLPPVPGSRPSAPPPEILGGYRLLKPLGEGGMGTVYEAEEIATGRHVALKMIATEHVAAEDAVERFRREGRLASAVVDSRCVFILAADEEAGRPYIVMELMPGTTLKDLVDKQGPLPPADAIIKILDVIDGLRAAHRLGVVHRDVKPSNCFLEEDGRVKIGDFGLSKSLVQEGHLTRTGSFLGTPLFASPEQVRGEPVDQQSDLYSVAATLYCLLTGRAPFQSSDAAVTLARIAADPPPPMRALRPDLPQALEDVVLRGLERDRARRWPDLDAFRTALLPFLPGWQEAAGLGVRFGAFLIDYLVLMAIGLVLTLGLFVVHGEGLIEGKGTHTPLQMLLGLLSWLLYFGVPESIWGCSVGKWTLSLRVRNAARKRRASGGRILVRTLCLYTLVNLGTLAALPLFWGLDSQPNDVQMVRMMLFFLIFYPLTAVGIGSIFITMRSRNGYRGLHEFASGTRVVRLPDAEKRTALRSGPREWALEQPPGLPQRVGTFAVRGAFRWEPQTKLLLGEDPSLERRVLIWLRPEDEPPLKETRRALTRPTRLRWLASGRQDSQQWDAFMAPTGTSVPDWIAADGAQPWSEVRLILEQLSAELAAAVKEGTLPPVLSIDQVQVQANGQVHLLDWPLQSEVPVADEIDGPVQGISQRALALLAEVAVLTLEGQPREPGSSRGRRPGVRAVLPEYASDLLGRLVGPEWPFRGVKGFHAALVACRERPAEVTPGRRTACLAVSTAMVGLAVLSCMFPAGWAPGLMVIVIQTIEMEVRKYALQDLEEGAWRESAIASLNPNPLMRLRGIAQLQADLRLRDNLRKQIEDLDHERQARMGSNWLMNQYIRAVEKEMEKQKTQGKSPWSATGRSRPAGYFRWAANLQPTQPSVSRQGTLIFGVMCGVMLVFWPPIWVFWAFLWRGGLSYRWLGLALARADGRPAARWQCAWRTLLVWTPPTALWAASLALDVWWWSSGRAPDSLVWVPWLASGLWWAGIALLPIYAVLAILFPRRSLHDWLAGTYVVPR
jgi:eukaryotic-like serine/threonine-protein kinase